MSTLETVRSFVERRPRALWIELGERVCRAMGMRKEFLSRTHKHHWALCDSCGQPMWVNSARLPLKCHMTPGCEGRHRKGEQ